VFTHCDTSTSGVHTLCSCVHTAYCSYLMCSQYFTDCVTHGYTDVFTQCTAHMYWSVCSWFVPAILTQRKLNKKYSVKLMQLKRRANTTTTTTTMTTRAARHAETKHRWMLGTSREKHSDKKEWASKRASSSYWFPSGVWYALCSRRDTAPGLRCSRSSPR